MARVNFAGKRQIAAGALVGSAALGTAMPVSAAGLDSRLAAIDAVFKSARLRQLAFAVDGVGAQVSQQRIRFDIPAGPLHDVVAAFQRATDLTLTLTPDALGTVQSPGVSGLFTVDQALEQLLMGTSVRFRFTSSRTGLLEIDALSESVQVTGRQIPVAVESPKYNLPLREIPQTIAVIPRAAMEAQGVTTLSEALRNVPGISLQAGEGGGASNTAGDMFNMRGFNAANSLFVDGVRDDGLISRDVYNLEQIEVFMGPTGSDVGRGTAAGYVNLSTKTPHVGASSSGILSFGTASQLRGSVDINQPLSARTDGGWLTKSAYRLNALWQDSGVPGRDYVTIGSKAFAPSLGLGLGTTSRVTVAGQFMRQNNVPDYGIPGAAWSEPLTPTSALATATVDQGNYYGSLGYDYDRGSQNSFLARAEHDVNGHFTVRNQSRFNEARREAVVSTIQNVASFNAATNQVTIARQGNERENKIFSNQTSLNGQFTSGRLQHNANAGVEYSWEEQFAPTLTGLGTRNPVDIFNPNPNDPITGYAVTRSGASTKGATNTFAVYGFDAVNVGERWQVTGGLRWEHFTTDFLAVDALGATTTNERASDGLVSGKAGLLYRVNAQGNVYASYGTTTTPPGTANFTLSAQPNNQNNPSVEPQRSSNFEVGSKWELGGGRLALQGAVFHTVNENVIFTVDATAIPPIYNQDDRQRVNGMSVGANGRILAQWQVMANYSYLDTALETQTAANNGNRLTLTPRHAGSVWTTYQLPRKLTLGGGIRATGEVFINAANTIKAPGYHLVDLLAEYPVNSHLTLRLNVYNLTNEVYIRNVNNNGGRYNPGNPRTAQVTTSIAF